MLAQYYLIVYLPEATTPTPLALISLVLRRVVLYKVGGCSRLQGVISLPALRGNINLTRLVRSLHHS